MVLCFCLPLHLLMLCVSIFLCHSIPFNSRLIFLWFSHFFLQISAEAAYLYDAVHLYAKALIKVLRQGDRPRNGTAIIEAIKGSKYRSAMG